MGVGKVLKMLLFFPDRHPLESIKTSRERKMHPSLNRLQRSCLILGLSLAACNVFNPSGEGESGPGKDAQLTEGENEFRQQDYKGASETYRAAIEADSTNS